MKSNRLPMTLFNFISKTAELFPKKIIFARSYTTSKDNQATPPGVESQLSVTDPKSATKNNLLLTAKDDFKKTHGTNVYKTLYVTYGLLTNVTKITIDSRWLTKTDFTFMEFLLALCYDPNLLISVKQTEEDRADLLKILKNYLSVNLNNFEMLNLLLKDYKFLTFMLCHYKSGMPNPTDTQIETYTNIIKYILEKMQYPPFKSQSDQVKMFRKVIQKRHKDDKISFTKFTNFVKSLNTNLFSLIQNLHEIIFQANLMRGNLQITSVFHDPFPNFLSGYGDFPDYYQDNEAACHFALNLIKDNPLGLYGTSKFSNAFLSWEKQKKAFETAYQALSNNLNQQIKSPINPSKPNSAFNGKQAQLPKKTEETPILVKQEQIEQAEVPVKQEKLEDATKE